MEKERSVKDYAMLVLKGMSMGAADVVPGVSGGTIAFIVGIYDELINSIKSINLHAGRLLCKGRLREFWKTINGNFLFFLLLGIGISVFSLAKLITYLLETEPVLVWSFFFGLVLASTWFVSKDIKEWNWKTVSGFLVGAVVAFYITVATPTETPSNLFFIFFCGVIAICAMILPGISGSFILVLLGKYFYIMEAVVTNRPYQIGGNVLNTGNLIENLPADACVEVPCLIDGMGVHPCRVGRLPVQCAAMNMTNINVQLLTIEAAVTRKKEHIYQAAMLDPHTGSELDLDTIVKMVDDLIETHGDWLPKYH